MCKHYVGFGVLDIRGTRWLGFIHPQKRARRRGHPPIHPQKRDDDDDDGLSVCRREHQSKTRLDGDDQTR